MKKRLLSFLALALVLAVVTAPAAMADHCSRCNAGLTQCRPAPGNGAASCVVVGGVCTLSGTCSGPHPLADTEEDPFGVDFVVASVERIDDAAQPSVPTEPRVASLETSQPVAR